jgi:ribosomal protein S18 acetylase RimI-like enzyme
VTVREATPADLETLASLWRAFEDERPSPPYEEVDEATELAEVAGYVEGHVALLAEDEERRPLGFALARMRSSKLGWISDLYVVPEARRGGVAAALARAATDRLRTQGAEVVELEVQSSNGDARSVYERWGFRESRLTLAAAVSELAERLAADSRAPSRGLVFAQTDDEALVDRAVRTFLPRLGKSPRTDVYPPANGWVAVEDALASSDPQILRRLAQELSYRTGGVVLALGVESGAVVRYILFERGSIADEYASLPEYDGPLPPGDVVALNANPTVAHRLTGADPEQVRAVARSASSASELPPAEELMREIADVLRVRLP